MEKGFGVHSILGNFRPCTSTLATHVPQTLDARGLPREPTGHSNDSNRHDFIPICRGCSVCAARRASHSCFVDSKHRCHGELIELLLAEAVSIFRSIRWHRARKRERGKSASKREIWSDKARGLKDTTTRVRYLKHLVQSDGHQINDGSVSSLGSGTWGR